MDQPKDNGMQDIPKLGRGKFCSVAKAALKYFYEEYLPEKGEDSFLDYGCLDSMHRIVDIAGAKHCSASTSYQVSKRLSKSPLWDKKYCPGFYKGFRGNGGANLYRPSKKGKEYYESNIKKTEQLDFIKEL